MQPSATVCPPPPAAANLSLHAVCECVCVIAKGRGRGVVELERIECALYLCRAVLCITIYTIYLKKHVVEILTLFLTHPPASCTGAI